MGQPAGSINRCLLQRSGDLATYSPHYGIFLQNGRFLYMRLLLLYPFNQLIDGQYQGLVRSIKASSPSVDIVALNFSQEALSELWLNRQTSNHLQVNLGVLGRRVASEDSALMRELIQSNYFARLLLEANKLLNRQDFSGTVRYQEREVEIRFRLRAIF